MAGSERILGSFPVRETTQRQRDSRLKSASKVGELWKQLELLRATLNGLTALLDMVRIQISER